MSSNSKELKSNNITKITISKLFKAPVKILAKARDLYVRSLTECSGHVGYGSVMGCPTGQYVPTSLPKSFSMNSTQSASRDDDYGELVRFASARSMSGRKIDPDFLVNECRRQRPLVANGTPRSRSVGIERIDEEKPSDFEKDDKVLKTDVHLRSKSYSAAKGRTRFYY